MTDEQAKTLSEIFRNLMRLPHSKKLSAFVKAKENTLKRLGDSKKSIRYLKLVAWKYRHQVLDILKKFAKKLLAFICKK